MGLFDIFKKKEKAKSLSQAPALVPTIQKKAPVAIPESEKRFYQPDEYYTKRRKRNDHHAEKKNQT